MRFNLRWLKDYVETDLSLADLVETITMAGHEVEECVDLGWGDGSIVVGEILEIEKHPDADKLTVCQVKADGEKPLNIVCGASNIAVGQKVPLAKIGASLPNGMKLKPTKIRGVASEGMMCSAKELGVGDDHSGIWIQAPDLPVGEPFDALLDIKITPNRPDATSLLGVARDVAAKTGGKLTTPEVKFPESDERAESLAKIVLEAKEDCPRYCARVIRNVTVGESPDWLKARLQAAGLRPRNNIVDVTNYVMLEMGHPLHAFDLDTLANRTVVVRLAKPGEKMRLLDDSEVTLTAEDLLIADPEKPIALAGVMGGGETEISDGTTNVLLEAAYFKPTTIRRTGKRHDKSTDASYRFERGADPKKLVNALHRAAQLIGELSGGEVLKGYLDAVADLPKRDPITLRIARCQMLSGLKLTGREVSDILNDLGFEIIRAGEGVLTVGIPSNRPDIDGEADLVEEVTRIYGYDKIPVELPSLKNAAETEDDLTATRNRLTDDLVGMGFVQAINFSFVGDEDNALAGYPDDPQTVRILNPLQKDQAVMRRSLVPSILRNVVRNLNHGMDVVRLFEVGRTYLWKDSAYDEGEDDLRSLDPATAEPLWICAVMCGTIKPDWGAPARDYGFFDIKGVAEQLVERLGITRTVIEPVTDVGYLHPGRGAALLKKGQRLCWFGELHPALARELDLQKRVYVLEMPVSGLVVDQAETPTYRELPRTPSIRRDIAVVAASGVPAQDLERTIRSEGGNLLTAVRLFDLYEGEHIEKGKRSLAFSLTFRDPNPEKTLTDDQATKACDKIVKALEEKHGAALR